MSLENYYESCKVGTWKDPDPKLCGCGGCGWFLSDLDIEFKCHYHYKGQPSREASEEEWLDYEAKPKCYMCGVLYNCDICVESKIRTEVETERLGDMHEKNLPSELDEIPF